MLKLRAAVPRMLILTAGDQRALPSYVGAAVFLPVSAFCLGQAIQVDNGLLTAGGLAWLTAATVACIAAMLCPAHSGTAGQGERLAAVVLTCGLLFQICQLFLYGSFLYIRLADVGDYSFYLAAIALAALMVVALAAGPRRTRRFFFVLLLFIHLLAGAWVIRHSPDPLIDVVTFHRDGISAFMRGHNPYAITYPNVYAGVRTRQPGVDFYGPGLFDGDRSTFGFVYPPLSLLLSAPGAVLAGDFRYSHLVAAAAAALLMGCAVPGRVAQLAALLYLFTPRTFLVVELGWTEPLVVLMFALVTFCVRRWPRGVPVAFGLLLAVKQYGVLALPAAVQLLPRPLRLVAAARFGLGAAAAALAVTLPLALWDISAFLNSTVRVLAGLVPRPDSLSYAAWLAGHGMGPLASWIGYPTLLMVSALVVWKAPATASGFASGAALLFLAFFAWSPNALANYYYFVIGALCCAVAAAQWGEVGAPAGLDAGAERGSQGS